MAKDAGEQLAMEVDQLGMTIKEALERTTFTLQLAMSFDIGKTDEASTPPVPNEMIGHIDGMTWFWNKDGEAWLVESRSTCLRSCFAPRSGPESPCLGNWRGLRMNPGESTGPINRLLARLTLNLRHVITRFSGCIPTAK